MLQSESMREFSSDFQLGIFQSIGFKEFDEYLSMPTDVQVEKKEALFEQCVAEMKSATRRYARYQVRWVKNRFIKSINLIKHFILQKDNYTL